MLLTNTIAWLISKNSVQFIISDERWEGVLRGVDGNDKLSLPNILDAYNLSTRIT
jgi:hypothetical protein